MIGNRMIEPQLASLLLVGAMIAIANVEHVRAEDARTEIRLWEGGAPGTPATKPADEPVLIMSRPAAGKGTATAVIVLPGGGYGHLAMDHEGRQIADWMNSLGITAFILKYRMSATGHMHPVPMMDGQRAIRTVRARAAEWQLDPAKIGVIGFSAGGHLASTLGTHFDAGDAASGDSIERVSSRPDFLILCYAVISLRESYAHQGSRRNLLGEMPEARLVESLSNETRVMSDTPPTFLFTTNEDTGVLPENSIEFYAALRRAQVPAELHVYERGPHGVGLAKEIPGTRTWPDRCRDWLEGRRLLQPNDNRAN
jgi:acetyl esterase/lipase